jgi:pyruvate/2-oxoglutarate dehydrogenase complex dihydrolipoamide dehydrogenase (E3) component
VERYNIVVIGAGSGGLTVAAGGAALGARVALLEKHRMGGDCLNYGCVPSKAFLRAARVAHTIRAAPAYGIRIDRRCRTSVANIWAVGDVAGPFQFTHWANHQARLVVRNALFPGSWSFDAGAVPWTTFTEPEGFVKVLAARRGGRILGAAIVHSHAGELLAELVLAQRHRLGLASLSSPIHVYPTLAEASRAAGDAYLRRRLRPAMKRVLASAFAWLRR